MSYKEKPGNVICKMFPVENYLQLHSMRFAIEEINNNPELLPNTTLGFKIYDSCALLQTELEGTLWMVTGQNKAVANFQCQEKEQMAAIIGHSISTYSILMAHILGLARYTHVREIKLEIWITISHFSTSSLLSDRTQFKSFFRTVPSDSFQSQGLAQLVLHFGWTWVGLVAVDNDYGQQGIQVIRREIQKSGACVAFTEYIQSSRPDYNTPYIVNVIKESTAKAVVVFSTDLSLMPLFDEILKQNVTGRIWIASEAWASSAYLYAEKYSRILVGTIGFAFHSETMPGFYEFIGQIQPYDLPGEAWTKMFLEETVGCALFNFKNYPLLWDRPKKNCTDVAVNFQSILRNSPNIRISYNLYSAVYVIAKALHDLSLCKIGKGPFSNNSCSSLWDFKPWQLLYYMQKVRVRLSSGRQIYFDKNGDPPAVYDIVQWKLDPEGKLKLINVGSYDTSATDGKTLNINISAMLWNTGDQKVPHSVCSEKCLMGFRKAVIKGVPACCFNCVPCAQGEIANQTDSGECYKCPWNSWPSYQKDKCLPKSIEFLSYEEPLGTALAGISVTSSIIPVAVLALLIHYKTTPIVRANNYILSCLLLVSLTLCFLCSLFFIGYPNPEKCLLRQMAFGVAFAFCVSCILAKTIMVVIAFKATKPHSVLKRWTSPRFSYSIIGLSTVLQFVMCIIWLALYPPFPFYNSKTESSVIILECNEGSSMAFWCILGYLSFLATISFLVAFISRKLPGSFNEAKFITFSMLAFLTVWGSFIPAYLSATGKYMVAMEVFAILSSSWAMLSCMFASKCYIILFQPKMNSRQHLMGRTKVQTIQK
ncbi:extracellular calcium-sensing receptor-like [Bombina bombina]|uniref:extracellular calcium-sensing receptor-like n=1 Tax=Bombina bombina TaxID=8345 RepID=UPI00235A94B4|nr:extracellular calcium-sensing receptor-like [Bombina bombina]